MVRSAKEKRNEQLNGIIKTIRNSKKIKDFNKMETSFVELLKAYEKARPAIMKEEGGATPRFFVRVLVEMEDLINETWEDRDYRKTMSKINAKSLGALRQKLRKHIREQFEADVAKFRENPDAEDEPEEAAAGGAEDASDSDDSEAEGGGARRKSGSKSRESSEPADKAKFKKGATPADDDDESDDSYWDSDSDESTESSSDDEPGMSLREKFLKKTTEGGEKKKKVKKPKVDKDRKRAKRLRDIDEEEDEDDDDEGKGKDKWITVDHGGLEKPKMFDKVRERGTCITKYN